MNTEITYTRQGDYELPNLTLPKQDDRPIGIWGCGCPADTSADGRSTDRTDR